MKIFIFILAMSFIIAAPGCSKRGPKIGGNSGMPTTAASVTSDARFRLLFTGDKSGIAYYIRKLEPSETSAMPEDNVIAGEKVSLLYIGIKAGNIVEAPLADRVSLGYKIPAELMEP